ncbi:MAG: hypothetical protein AAF492_09510, partial [Verrucomicrobiota bacterium]
LTFQTRPGRTYRIEQILLLPGPQSWTVMQSNIPGTGGLQVIPMPEAQHRVYYRIGVETP